jgi:hypothetical protein
MSGVSDMRCSGFRYKDCINSALHLIIIFILVCSALVATGQALAVQDYSQPNSPAAHSRIQTWQYRNLWADDVALNDLVVADLIPELPGDEIITVGDNYLVTLLTGNGQSWQFQRIYDTEFLTRSVAVGDFYPGPSGSEIVVGDALGFLTMLYFDSDLEQWYSERIYEDYDWILDVAVGDIDPDHPGDEILSVGESQQLIYIYFDHENDTWSNEIIWNDIDNLNVVSIGELDDPSDGSEIVVAGSNFDVSLVDRKDGSWHIQKIWHESTFIKELEIAEINGDNETGEILVMGFTGELLMLTNDGSDNWLPEVIWKDKGDINDVILKDFQPQYSGLEIMALGGSGRIVILGYDSGIWFNETIYSISHVPVKIAVGDFDAFSAGPEYAMLESIGRVTALNTEKRDFSMVSPKSVIRMFPGETIELDILVHSNGGFDELVYINVDNIILPPNSSARTAAGFYDTPISRASGSDLFEIEFKTPAIVPTDFTTVSITLSEYMGYDTAQITFVGASSTTTHFLNITFEIIFPGTPPPEGRLNGMNLVLDPRVTYLVADYSTNLMANLEFSYHSNDNQNDETEVTFSMENAPLGVQLMEDLKRADIKSNLSAFLIKLRADSNVPPGTYYIFISAITLLEEHFDSTGSTLERVRILEVIIESPTTKDFLIEISPGAEVEITEGEGFNWTLKMIARNSFAQTVQLELTNPEPNLKAALSSSTLSPIDIITLELEPVEQVDLGSYSLIITAKSSDRTRFALISIFLSDPVKGFELVIDPLSQEIKSGEPANLNLTFKPHGGFENNIYIKLFFDDDGNIEWPGYAVEINLAADKTVDFDVLNLTKPGMYNFTIRSGAIDRFETSAKFTVAVIDPDGTANGGTSNGGEDKNEDGNGSNSLLFALIGIIVVIIVAVGVMIFLRKPSRRARESRSQKEFESKSKSGSKEGVKQVSSVRHTDQQVRIDRVEYKGRKRSSKVSEPKPSQTAKSDQFELGTKVFKPGGSHEFDELNHSGTHKPKRKKRN